MDVEAASTKIWAGARDTLRISSESVISNFATVQHHVQEIAPVVVRMKNDITRASYLVESSISHYNESATLLSSIQDSVELSLVNMDKSIAAMEASVKLLKHKRALHMSLRKT